MESDNASSLDKIYRTFLGGFIAKMLNTVADLGIPQLLVEPKPFSQLAEQTPAIPEKLERILLALESLGYFSFNQETGLWSNSPLSELLLDESINAMARWFGISYEFDMLSKFSESVKENTSAIQLRFGCHSFKYIGNRPDLLETFQRCMRAITQISGDGYKSVDLSSVNRVLDIGGGDGSLLIELLKWNSHISGAVYELEEVKPKAENNFSDHNLQQKFSVIEGNFLIDISKGYDP